MDATGDGAQRLYLIRHGQTALNAAGRLRGLADPPLDAHGHAQAARLGERFAGSGAVAVYSSPLQRAVQTAEAVAGPLGLAPIVDADFNDRDYGQWTGQVRLEVVAAFGRVDDAPGVEKKATVLVRARPAVERVLDAHPGGDVVVVTHDVVIRQVVHAIDPRAPHGHLRTATWTLLERDADGAWTVHEVGRRGALPGAGDSPPSDA
ncbi:histidine phosphatase family protein [Agromyces seonyuensis]|uniref:Histidine phosphatase family protein n=1 Tax=Agromyces seonyuensis TaxID=2662446 RepID=A0A6I4NTK7_9MICO|nr:histidine phosphatase family protein [Agromyces seonyuensis]MWB97776.1 histidine phosphatase family protein [Agromyces seonyuensis]